MTASIAWLSLSGAAVNVYVELRRRYNGGDNGDLSLSLDKAARRFPPAVPECATLRLRVIKIAARVIEGAARIRIRPPSACPDKTLFRLLAGRFATVGP